MKNTSEVTSALFLEEKAQGSELSTEYAIYCSFTGKPVKLSTETSYTLVLLVYQ